MENFMYNETTRAQIQAEYDAAEAAEKAAIEAQNAAYQTARAGGGSETCAAYEAVVQVRLALKQARIDAWHNLQTANLEW